MPDQHQFRKATKVIYSENSVDETDEQFLERKILAIEVINKALAVARDCVFGSSSNLAVFLAINDAEKYERELIIEAARPYNNESVLAELCKLYE